MTVNYGEVITCDINPAGDFDLFRFSGSEQQTVSIQVSWKSGSNYPCFVLLDPGNAQIANECGGFRASRGEYRLVRTGVYTVRVYEQGNSETMTYELFLYRVSPPLTATSVSFGQNIIGDIGHAGDLDFYSFEGAAGTTVAVQVSWRSGSNYPCFALFDPTNARLAEQCGSFRISRGEFRLTRTGPHVIRAFEQGYDETVTYEVLAQQVSPAQGVTSIEFSQNLTGDIRHAGELDFYTFNGVSGTIVAVQASWKSGANYPCFALYDSTDVRIAEQCGSFRVSRGEFRLTRTGSYLVRVYEQGYDETATYEVLVQRVSPPLTTTQIGFGQNLTGSISHAGELDFYTFSGVAGTVVVAQVSWRSGANYPCFALFDSADTRISEQCGSFRIVRSEFRLARTETYTLRVYEQGYAEAVTYEVFLQRLSPPVNLMPIDFDQSLNGDLGHAGKLDFYSFSVTAGSTVVIQVEWRSGGNYPCFALFDPTETRIGEQCGTFRTARGEYRLGRSGGYTIRVYAQGYDETLSYAVMLRCVGSCPRPTLKITTGSPLPEGVSGRPYSQALAVEGGQPTYTWSVVSGTLPPGLSLDPSTGRLAGTPSTAGTFTFTVQVADGSGNATTAALLLTIRGLLNLDKTILTFVHQIGGATPGPQTLAVSGGEAVTAFTVGTNTTSGGNWLSANPTSGRTPAILTVAVNPSGLLAGRYSGTVALSAPDNSRLGTEVLLTVNPVGGQITPDGIVSGASFARGPVAPGQLITIFGSGIGPASLTTLRLNEFGQVASMLAETQLLFNGIPAPLIYVQQGQLSALVPYSVAGIPNTQVQVEYLGARTNTVSVEVVPSAPGLFTLDSSGKGPGAIQNQDLTVNSPANPAEKGSVVILYGTGEGETDPQVADGTLASAALLPRPRLPVSVTIGGVPAAVLYAGSAAGQVVGVLQVNVRVPEGAPSGNAVPLVLTVGNAGSAAGVTMAVR